MLSLAASMLAPVFAAVRVTEADAVRRILTNPFYVRQRTGVQNALYTEVNIDGIRRTIYATDNGFWLAAGEERLLGIHVWWRAQETRSKTVLTLGAWNTAPQQAILENGK